MNKQGVVAEVELVELVGSLLPPTTTSQPHALENEIHMRYNPMSE